MKPTDFSIRLSEFLISYLPAQRNLSPHTIRSYRDAFVLFLRFLRDRQTMKIQRVRLEDMSVELVRDFLSYLEEERKACIRTRNQRLAVLHSFFRWLQTEEPKSLLQCQQILAIPFKKREHKQVEYLTPDQLQCLLSQPDLGTKQGRRDAVLLSILYDTGARVQEICDLRVRDIRLEDPALVRLRGKGRKERSVPLMTSTTKLISDYLAEWKMKNGQDRREDPVFQNRRRQALTRSGIAYILAKHARQARKENTTLPEGITPHVLRHTKAMHMLQSGIPAVIIRDFLGHSDIRTTEIYAKADMEMKRKALEKLPGLVTSTGLPTWKTDGELLEWLRSL